MIKEKGLHIKAEQGKWYLMHNYQVVVSKPIEGSTKHGLYVNGRRLELYGAPVAQSGSERPQLIPKSLGLYFGEVELTTSGECINISMSDYNRLLAGENVDGYKAYDANAIYNIVSDVSTSETVTYTIEDGVIAFSSGATAEQGSNMIYDNLSGGLTENTVDLTNEVSNTECPVVHIRYFNPIIAINSGITLDYFVDTRKMSSINYDTIHDTFTLIVTTPSGTVKKTTYAGFSKIELPAFTFDSNDVYDIQWFSVKCIDSNGVSSVEQFFDVMVKKPHIDEVYNMNVQDLETYGIVPNDSTAATAIANKAALTTFFAQMKAAGKDKVVMYNNPADNNGDGTIYWVDYHLNNGGRVIPSNGRYVGGDNIAFPDDFTVDLNNSTIAARICNDLTQGEIINLRNNVNTHIVNGKIRGNFDGFDFDYYKGNYAKPNRTAEWLSVVSMTASRFCSFENLDVSGAVGYDGRLEALGCNTGSSLYGSGSIGLYDYNSAEPNSVDLGTGAAMKEEGMICTGFWAVGAGKIVSFGRNGYGTYLNVGPKRIIFYCFYDSAKNYLGYCKSSFYRLVLTPANTAFIKIVGYGSIVNNWDQYVPQTGWTPGNDTDWSPVSNEGVLYAMQPQLCRNIVYRNCHWHNTRTTALTNWCAKGVLLDGCTYKDIALGNFDAYGATDLLGDLEDSWQWASNGCIKGCKWLSSGGNREILIYYIQSLDFIDNEGFKFSDGGGVESGVVENNKINILRIDRNRSCYYPIVVYRDNNINAVSVNYGKFKYRDVGWTVAVAEKTVSMSNTTIINKCQYQYLKLRDSRNG